MAQPSPNSLLDVDGHQLDYVVKNDSGSRPTLVFLHEGLGSIDLWRSFPDDVVSRTDHRGLLYSRFGHGWSEAATEPRPIDFFEHEALDVLPVILDQLDAENPILIGHSDGASISLVHAVHHKVRALVLLAPHVFVEEDGLAKIRELHQPEQSRGLVERMAKYHRDPEATFWAWNDVWLDPGFQTWNIEETLGKIECPVLLIQGLDDDYGTVAHIDAIEQQVSGPVQRLELEGGDHSPHLSRPDQTLVATVRFIEALNAGE